MPVEFNMPKLGLTMEQGTILSWLVEDGAPVTAGTPVLVIETDKTETEVEVNGTGVLRYVASVGATMLVGEVIAHLFADGESTAAPTPAPVSTSSGPANKTVPPALTGLETAMATIGAPATITNVPGSRIVASPNARRVAAELGVDLRTIGGTGPGGRITSEDVHDSADSHSIPASPAALVPAPMPGRSGELSTQPATTTNQVDISRNSPVVASVAARQLADLLGVDLRAVAADPAEGRVTRDGVAAHVRARLTTENVTVSAAAPLQSPSSTVAMTGMRGTIAKRMHASLREMAQLTLTMDADMDAVVADRSKRKKHADESDEPVPGFTDYVIAAVARALRAHPRVNSQVVGNEIALLPEVHVGFAVALDEGLVVPVVRHADRLSLADLADETSRLARSARARTLTLADMEGGTFSVSALGMFGVDAFTPVINPPNTAILGVGRIRDDVVARKGKASTTKRLTLSLTWDHRVFDGAPAAEFTRTVVELLGEPGELG